MITVWDFGGVIFKRKIGSTWYAISGVDFYGSDVNHSVADGVLKYIPQYLQDTNVDHDIVSKFLGYRAELTVELINIKTYDGTSIAGFFNDLNTYYGTSEYGCQVNVDTTGSGGVWVENLMLTSDISMVNISRLEIGQRLTLKFVAKELTQNIPTITSNSAEFYIVDENENNLVDESGNKIIGFE